GGHEAARGLDDAADLEYLAGQLGRALDRLGLDLAARDPDLVVPGRHLVRQVAEDRVVLQEVGQGPRVGDVVDRHEVEVLVVERGAQDVASDAPETIDADTDCHEKPPIARRGVGGGAFFGLLGRSLPSANKAVNEPHAPLTLYSRVLGTSGSERCSTSSTASSWPWPSCSPFPGSCGRGGARASTSARSASGW